MGWNVECVVFLFVLNERWLFFLFRNAKMGKVPHHRRECEEYAPRSEICARAYIVLHLRNGSRRGTHSVAVKQMWIFKISGEVSYWEDEKTGPESPINASIRPTNNDPLFV